MTPPTTTAAAGSGPDTATPLVERHRGWLERLVAARTCRRDAVDDVLQEVAVAVGRSGRPPIGEPEERPWLCAIAIRQCALFLRRASRHTRLLARAAALACVEHRRLTRLLRAAGSTVMPPTRAGRVSTVQGLLSVAAMVALVAAGTAMGYRLGLSRGDAGETTRIAAARPASGIGETVAESLAPFARPLLPEAAAQVLREAGIDVREEPVVFLVDDRNGERWAVPETQLQLRLVGNGRVEP